MTGGSQLHDQGTPGRNWHELMVMTDAALGMLLEGGELDRTILNAPPSVLRRLIIDEALGLGLSEEDTAVLVEGATSSPQALGVAEVVLTELRREKPIRDDLDAATARRGELMFIDPGSIAAAALLVAVLKVRRIKVSKSEGMDVAFEPVKSAVVNALLGFLKGAG
jgi:hypothetical protein